MEALKRVSALFVASIGAAGFAWTLDQALDLPEEEPKQPTQSAADESAKEKKKKANDADDAVKKVPRQSENSEFHAALRKLERLAPKLEGALPEDLSKRKAKTDDR